MRKVFYILFILALLNLMPQSGFAAEKLQVLGEGKYFTVYGTSDIDSNALLMKLNYDYFLSVDNAINGGGQGNTLAQTMDALYSEVSDILDLHSYNFKGNIKVLTSQKAVSDVFKSFFGQDYSERSFFVPEGQTIYISYQDLTLGMLAHEIAHALISHYFVVPPPAKMQEVLSGYVEYSIRKSTKTLP